MRGFLLGLYFRSRTESKSERARRTRPVSERANLTGSPVDTDTHVNGDTQSIHARTRDFARWGRERTGEIRRKRRKGEKTIRRSVNVKSVHTRARIYKYISAYIRIYISTYTRIRRDPGRPQGFRAGRVPPRTYNAPIHTRMQNTLRLDSRSRGYVLNIFTISSEESCARAVTVIRERERDTGAGLLIRVFSPFPSSFFFSLMLHESMHTTRAKNSPTRIFPRSRLSVAPLLLFLRLVSLPARRRDPPFSTPLTRARPAILGCKTNWNTTYRGFF